MLWAPRGGVLVAWLETSLGRGIYGRIFEVCFPCILVPSEAFLLIFSALDSTPQALSGEPRWAPGGAVLVSARLLTF